MGMGVRLGREGAKEQQLQRQRRRSFVSLVFAASLALNAAFVLSVRSRSTAERDEPALRRTRAHTDDVAEIDLAAAVIEPASQSRKSAAKLLEVEGKPCANDGDVELVERLRDIVLIVNANIDRDGHNAGHFVHKIYGRFFETVVVIGPEAIPEYGIEARGLAPFRSEPHFAYFHLPSIVARYPNTEGYLWLDDDVWLSYWALKDADKTHFWLPSIPGCEDCQGFVPFKPDETAVLTEDTAADAAARRHTAQAISECDPKYIAQYKEHLKGMPSQDGYLKSVIDAFYIPRRYAEALAFDLLPIFRDHRVRAQAAIPTMFAVLESPKDHDPVLSRMQYQSEDAEVRPVLRDWNKDSSAYHPWRLSNPESRGRSMETLAKGDSCLAQIAAD